MDHWYSEGHFENEDDLNEQVEKAQHDLKILKKIQSLFKGLTVKARLLAEGLSHDDVKHDVATAVEDLEFEVNRISRQSDFAEYAAECSWEEPDDPNEHSTMCHSLQGTVPFIRGR